MFTQITILSPTRICPITLIFTCAYTNTYLFKHLFWSKCEFIGQLLSYFQITIPGRVIRQSLLFSFFQKFTLLLNINEHNINYV